jgi:Tfp pilus assembly protein PilO
MMLQVPVPPTPPSPPPFDPNLFFMQDNGPPVVLLIVIAALTAAVIILWPLMRAFARRLEAKGGDPTLRADLEQMRLQLGEVDTLQHRVAELEERVDFTERLLAQAHDAQGKVLRGETS